MPHLGDNFGPDPPTNLARNTTSPGDPELLQRTESCTFKEGGRGGKRERGGEGACRGEQVRGGAREKGWRRSNGRQSD